ncbi:Rrf2 family protein [Arachidicoccus rhizosphaerae]|uniref:Rrf2 family protein n=1 Tax=Arachidicoccus rhizosphaerae TaxID=551991 RepID=A0A1H3ZUV6_9BACT|nr:Rrf2 family transcriptional regulator [Arachidicoccus rhizosphaerae]SEA27440.1 Rrf2 family protein [Arachidicoccus rhizosphaerae]
MNGRFPIAIHIMTLLCYAKEQLSSDYIAGSLNINPVQVRKALKELIDQGLVLSREGKNGGYQLARSADIITLAEIYRSLKPEALLGISKNTPNPDCPVGRQIKGHLDQLYEQIDLKLERQLSATTLKAFCQQFQ